MGAVACPLVVESGGEVRPSIGTLRWIASAMIIALVVAGCGRAAPPRPRSRFPRRRLRLSRPPRRPRPPRRRRQLFVPHPSPTPPQPRCREVVAESVSRSRSASWSWSGSAPAGWVAPRPPLEETPRRQRRPARQLDGRGGRHPSLVGDVPENTRGPEGVRTLLAVDQEGGLVQRLKGRGFDRIPAARDQAELSDAELTRRASRWGSQLRAAGISASLAPVADVVPADLAQVNAPIGQLGRGYGASPKGGGGQDAGLHRGHGSGRRGDGGQALSRPRAGCAATPTSPAG